MFYVEDLMNFVLGYRQVITIIRFRWSQSQQFESCWRGLYFILFSTSFSIFKIVFSISSPHLLLALSTVVFSQLLEVLWFLLNFIMPELW